MKLRWGRRDKQRMANDTPHLREQEEKRPQWSSAVPVVELQVRRLCRDSRIIPRVVERGSRAKGIRRVAAPAT